MTTRGDAPRGDAVETGDSASLLASLVGSYAPTDVVLQDADGSVLNRLAIEAVHAAIDASLARSGWTGSARIAVVPRLEVHATAMLLATASSAVAAPLAPHGTESTYLADLDRLQIDAILDDGDLPLALVRAADAASIPRLAVAPGTPDSDATSDGAGRRDPPPCDEVRLLLSTSGTTATPKVVPIRGSSLLHSARAVADAMHLGPSDICLAIMPIFHVHGIVAGLTASLVSGGRVALCRRSDAQAVLDVAEEVRPTWTTAVPTRLIDLMRAAERRTNDGADAPAGGARRWSFRALRSSSSPLAPAVLERLERVFGVPVVEAYGMTECAHQICSNPLPPGQRVAGSVGFPIGIEVAVRDDAGRPVPAGVAGRVLVDGPSVTLGYERAPSSGWIDDADGRAWFDTGDVGTIDADGRLTLVGRSKEMIDRGGENVAPATVDRVLLDHPDVVEAMTFAVPHATLGEDVAAAVVRRAGASTSLHDLRSWSFSRLLPHEVPSTIVEVDELPRSANGKPLRIGAFERLAAHVSGASELPRGPLEELVASTFDAILGVDPRTIGRDDNFFILGGDSLSGARAASTLSDRLAIDVTPGTIFAHPTPRTLAAALDLAIDRALADDDHHGVG